MKCERRPLHADKPAIRCQMINKNKLFCLPFYYEKTLELFFLNGIRREKTQHIHTERVEVEKTTFL